MEVITDCILRLPINAVQKRVLAYITNAEYGKPLAAAYIAQALDLSRSAVSKAINELLTLGAIERTKKRLIGYIYKCEFSPDHENFFVIIDNANSGHNRSKLSSSSLLVLAYLQLRQGDNGQSWRWQKTMADDLGMTQQAISAVTIGLEKERLITIRHANGGLRQGNKYKVLVTPRMRVFEGAPICTSSKSRTKLKSQVDNRVKDFKRISGNAAQPQEGAAGAACFDSGTAAKKELLTQPVSIAAMPRTIGKANTEPQEAAKKPLFNQDTTSGRLEIYNELKRMGIDYRSAYKIAENRDLTLQSLINLQKNALLKHHESGGLWKVKAGYYVKAIEQSLREGKPIELTKSSQKVESAKNKAFSLLQNPLKSAELEKRKEFLKQQLCG